MPTDKDWVEAIDHELVVSLQSPVESFRDPKKAINDLIDWHIRVALDPRCNGGFELKPKRQSAKNDMWISVDDKLPSRRGIHLGGERVLIFYNVWNEVLVACRVFTSEKEWCWMDEEDSVYPQFTVSHWMPLPGPPK